MKLNKRYLKSSKAITLIALVITIIVILILAGVAIATLTGDNGLLQKVGKSNNKNIEAEIEEKIRLAWNKVYMDSYLDSTTNKATALQTELKGSEVKPNGDFLDITYKGKTISINVTTGEIKQTLPVITAGQKAPATSNAQYKSGNYTAIIPAGFTVSNVAGETNIETGLVIRDDDGNEFVWIPIGINKKTNNQELIELGRYKFNDSGVLETSKYDGSEIKVNTVSYFEYSKDDSAINNGKALNGNIIAKDIDEFLENTKRVGGFYIGRYEARKKTINGKTLITENGNYIVYNNISQEEAAQVSRTMYSENDFYECDLINSFAWDTATLFLQEFDNRSEAVKRNSNYRQNYSIQRGLSSGFKYYGTNASNVADVNKDKICNVYDMADNYKEYTTESSSSSAGYVWRGGYQDNPQWNWVESRGGSIYNNYKNDVSFRMIIYIK